MELKITRLSSDERYYAIDSSDGARFASACELKRWLLYVGVEGSTIVNVLDMRPTETVTIIVAAMAA
jgi:hypothetical protein